MADYYLHGVDVEEVDDGVRVIRTAATSIIFLCGTAAYADAVKFPLNTPVLLNNTPRAALALIANRPANQLESNADGTLYAALKDIYAEAGAVVIVNRVEEGVNLAATLANVAGNVLAETGMFAAIKAKAIVGVKPRILIAPGFTHQLADGAPNQVIAAMKTVSGRLRAAYLTDAPNTTDVAAADMADDIGDARAILIEPFVKYANDNGSIVTRPSSAMLAGVIARTDNEKGFWVSPSNQKINGILGTARPISFDISDPATTANWLNERNVTTIINEDGFRVWGQRGTGADPKWKFWQVRRIADTVYEAIAKSMLWAMDRPFSPNLFEDIAESVQGYLDFLKGKGAILGGKIWLDAELNTEQTLSAGEIYFDFDLAPAPGLERIRFRARLNNGYFSELITRQAA